MKLDNPQDCTRVVVVVAVAVSLESLFDPLVDAVEFVVIAGAFAAFVEFVVDAFGVIVDDGFVAVAAWHHLQEKPGEATRKIDSETRHLRASKSAAAHGLSALP